MYFVCHVVKQKCLAMRREQSSRVSMPNLHPKTHTSNITIIVLRLKKYQQKSRKRGPKRGLLPIHQLANLSPKNSHRNGSQLRRVSSSIFPDKHQPFVRDDYQVAVARFFSPSVLLYIFQIGSIVSPSQLIIAMLGICRLMLMPLVLC